MKRQRRYYEMGEDYWWFANKYNIVSKYLDRLAKGGSQRILDFGCGPGNLIMRLLKYGEIYGADISLDALRYCRNKRQHYVFQIEEGARVPIRANSFDFVIALDVLEHIEDDFHALLELYRICKVGGRIMLTVPAYPFLWGSHDELDGHKRRYQKSKLERMMKKANFKVEKISYVYILFFIPLYLLRKFKKFLGIKKDDFTKVSPGLNRLLLWLNGLELHFLTKFNLPFGTSIFCIGEKVRE